MKNNDQILAQDSKTYEPPKVERIEFRRNSTTVMGNCTHWKDGGISNGGGGLGGGGWS